MIKNIFQYCRIKKLFIKDAAEFQQKLLLHGSSLEKIKRLSYELYGKVKIILTELYQLIPANMKVPYPSTFMSRWGIFSRIIFGILWTCFLYEGISAKFFEA